MVYDYIITKPPLDEDTLAHYGVKGMKWRKHLKGKYYSAKSKILEKKTKLKRRIVYKNKLRPDESTRRDELGNWGASSGYSYDNGKASSISGTGSTNRRDYEGNPGINNYRNSVNVESGIAAGRERAKKHKKK